MVRSTIKPDIIVAVDGSPDSEAAIVWAAREAVLRGAAVKLLHVIAPMVVDLSISPVPENFIEWQKDNAKQILAQAEKTLLANTVEEQTPDVHSEVRFGSVVGEIVDATRQVHLAVVGSRGMGAVGRAVLGSVSSGLVHHAHCPVAVVHVNETQPADLSSPVLLGVDGSPASEKAIALAFDEASRRGVELVALHAWSDVGVFPVLGMDWRRYEDEGREVLGERLAGWSEQYPEVRVQRRIVCDQPARWLIDASADAQLVVVGSHGRGGFTGMLLGSVSGAVAQSAKAPVIVVRS
ncbi:hypothetical protein MMAG44476_25274 [Mycolicibacterium mageritense DSM 44476 = CIP 104973]|uniref:Universal stress protein n=1 Tax=Mycolicibacterium mageritense TaxID=53462 RepID=A0AAI8XRM3_MYCME|nr:universal stress protein [Mycolicibacterium mageritense]MBN3458575.1 universal stress protein [Mycobacterium sp. DSM 3803]MCC9180553.1 universal stress protein [Mycolicibacterium mageritense]TXI61939.1 MAG: universal stress protein [Mycolicibacterium mageritense]CDO25863.1 universal stress protein family protein [Mycolicibacterium mageritense DSM 44476 = CIP 104973]BBX37470.1 universal stress protein [Mycolicibacterium mageritense]